MGLDRRKERQTEKKGSGRWGKDEEAGVSAATGRPNIHSKTKGTEKKEKLIKITGGAVGETDQSWRDVSIS